MEFGGWLIIAFAILALIAGVYLFVKVLQLIVSALEKYIKER